MRKKETTFILWIYLFVLFAIILLFLHFTTINKIKNITINQKSFSKFFPPNKSFLAYFFLSKNLINQNPEIIKIELKPDFLWQSISINIKKSEPVAKICDKEKCYILDNFARILSIGKEEKLFFIESKVNLTTNSLLNPKLTELFFNIFSYSNWKPYEITKAIIHENLDVSLFDSKEREFLFDSNKDISEQIKKWHLILDDQRIEKAKRIDLRIPKKIFLLNTNLNTNLSREEVDTRNDRQVW
jgi:hypothetical protein